MEMNETMNAENKLMTREQARVCREMIAELEAGPEWGRLCEIRVARAEAASLEAAGRAEVAARAARRAEEDWAVRVGEEAEAEAEAGLYRARRRAADALEAYLVAAGWPLLEGGAV